MQIIKNLRWCNQIKKLIDLWNNIVFHQPQLCKLQVDFIIEVFLFSGKYNERLNLYEPTLYDTGISTWVVKK